MINKSEAGTEKFGGEEEEEEKWSYTAMVEDPLPSHLLFTVPVHSTLLDELA